MNSILGILILSILTFFSAVAFSLVLNALFSQTVAECQTLLEQSRKRMFWLGVVNTLFIIVVATLFFFLGNQTGIILFPIVGVFVVAFFISGSLLGLTSIMQFLGDLVYSEYPPLKKHGFAAGSILLALLTPYVGWFLLLPYLIFIGYGAFITQTYNKRKKSKRENS